MGSLDRYNNARTQRLGNDSIYGQGTDGNVTISANTTLTSDKYYDNLTVNSNITLLTNGYRVFVKNTLTNNGYIGVGTVTAGEPSASIAAGTIVGTSSLTAITYSLGGSGGGSTANAAPTWLLQNIQELLENKLATSIFTPSAGQTAGGLYGGSAGVTGATGTSRGYTNSDTWTGKAGAAGGAGSTATHYQYNNHTHHNTDHSIAGNAGNAGNAGTFGAGGAGGAGGVGGGVVLIFAKTIAGTGTIFAKGKSGSAGSAGSTGTAGTSGNNGHVNGTHSSNSAHGFHHSHCGSTNCKGACNHSQHGVVHYNYGPGGAGGAGSPALTGDTGQTGYKGGGGGIVIVTDSTPANQTYNVSAGSSGTGSATNGYSYIILNQ